ncbi:MAG TPA: GntR family transcriptional regulator [bacterium]|nr:GntR family transcriptional regulator [bacterium]HPP29950.1 GntR family transcriptional regulator [bacterium]
MDIKVSPKSKWEEIFDTLKNRLENGEYSVGTPFYTIDEICQKFNVSRITAKRVFQELKNEGWILPVRRRGAIVNRSHIQKDIFFIVGSPFLEEQPSVTSDYFVINQLLKGMHAEEKFYNVKITTIGHRFFFSHLKNFINKDVLMSAQLLYDFKDWFEKHPSTFQFLKSDIQPVLLHSFEKYEGFSMTRTDYEKGIGLAVEHLVNKGHKDIAYLTKDINFPPFYLRFKGFIDTLKKKNIPLKMDLVKVTSDIKSNVIWDDVKKLFSLKKRPTAIVCASDVIAINVLEYCEKNGVRVPEDIAVTGFDNRGETEFSPPPLTTVDSKLEEQGIKAVELIIKRSNTRVLEPVVITLEPELIIRKST